MSPLTAEWVAKAEVDFELLRLLQRPDTPSLPDIVCFHAQQNIEKYLKAWLQESGLYFPKTHDLKALLYLIQPPVSEWMVWDNDLADVSRHAVNGRYPGSLTTDDDAAQALRVAQTVREAVRTRLGLAKE